MLIVLNDPPYGTERSFNALRLAMTLSRKDDVELRIFLIGDAVGCAAVDQKLPQGYYNLERMITSVARHGGEIGCCGSCMEARGMDEDRLAKGARRSSMDEFTDWVLWADNVVTF